VNLLFTMAETMVAAGLNPFLGSIANMIDTVTYLS
jgi:hypothetical protein